MSAAPIKVKFLSKVDTPIWLHQLPDNHPITNNFQFIFDRHTKDYDWLVVYDDLPLSGSERFPMSSEQLACHPDNTILITIEPATVKLYGKNYTEQFRHILTSQPDYSLPHKGHKHQNAPLYWFYGVGKEKIRPYSEISSLLTPKKTRNISVIWSNKKQRHTLHHQRYKFLSFLKQHCDDIDIFGPDDISLDDKADALDPYKYHIAIENYFGNNHWTEKISDAFLGQTLPFYYGCPNLGDYFPERSFIPINIFQPEKSLETILAVLENDEYEKRIKDISMSKRLLLDKYNIFIVLAKLINEETKPALITNDVHILSRRAANRKSIFSFVHYLIQKAFVRIINLFKSYIWPV